jgi:hypothetical protein
MCLMCPSSLRSPHHVRMLPLGVLVAISGQLEITHDHAHNGIGHGSLGVRASFGVAGKQ